MSAEFPRKSLHERVLEATAILVTGIWIIALLTGQNWWWWVMLGGYLIVIPLIEVLFNDGGEEWSKYVDWSKDQEGEWQYSSEGTDEKHAHHDHETTSEPREATDNRDALDTLKNRYARGELTDEQFERKLEMLMENDTVEDVEDRFRNENRERNLERE